MKKPKPVRPLMPWGIALKALLDQAGKSQNAVVKLAEKDNSEFYRACRGPRGPGVKQIDNYLAAMGRSWIDFAETYEAVKRGEIIEVDGEAMVLEKDKGRRVMAPRAKNKASPVPFEKIKRGA